MIPYIYPIRDCYPPLKTEIYEVGELVETIMGQYGIVLGFGPHTTYHNDRSNYYKVLIDGYIYHYVSIGLKKVVKKT